MSLRFYGLAAQSFWSDEGNSVALARAGLVEIATRTALDIHPPLYYWLLHGWMRLTGDSEVAVRSLSAFTDVLLVVITYRLARHLFGRRAGLVAAFAAAISPFQIYYAQEARMYALLALLGGLTAWMAAGAARACSGDGTSNRVPCLRWLSGYVVSATLGLYTHYSFPVVWGAVILAGLVYIWSCRHTVRIRWPLSIWLCCQLVPLIIYLPWMPIALRQLTTWPAPATVFSTHTLVTIWNTLVAGPLGTQMSLFWPIVLALLTAIGLVRLILTWYATPPKVTLVVLYLVLPLVLTAVLFKPAYLKFLLAAVPAWHIVLAVALVGAREVDSSRTLLSRAMLWIGVLVLVLAARPVLLAYYTDPKLARDDYRGIARYLEAVATPEDTILLNAPGQHEVFSYYYRGNTPVHPLPRTRPPDAEATTAELASIAARSQYIYAIYWATEESDPQGLVESYLQAHCFGAAQWWVGNLRVALYATPSPRGEWTGTEIHFGDHITLTGYRVIFPITEEPSAAQPGDILGLQLRWRTDAPLSSRYIVFLQALDSANHLVGQRDAPPVIPSTMWQVGEEIVDQHGLWILPGTPPGSHRLIVGLYDAASGARLPVLSSQVDATADYAILSTFEVKRPAKPLLEVMPRMRHPAYVRVGPFRLLGSDCFKLGHDSDPEAAIYPGDPLHIVLYWRAEDALHSDWHIQLKITTESATILTGRDYPLAGVEYPTSLWSPGDVVRAQYDLFVPVEAAPTTYQLHAQLTNSLETIALPATICSFTVQAIP